MTLPFSKPYPELVITVAVFVMALVFFNFSQPHISYESEPLLDAHQYAKGYLFFNKDLSHYSVKFPYNTRIGIPFLATQVSKDDLILNFKLVNSLLLLLAIPFLFETMKRLHLPKVTRYVFWFFILFHWLGPVRYLHHEPIQVDSACYLIYGLFCWILVSKKYRWVYFVTLLSVLFKESLFPFLLVTSAFFFYNKQKTESFHFFISFLVGLFVLYGLRYFFPPVIEHWQHHGAITILRIFKMILLSPTILIRWFASIVVTFGFLLVFKNYSKKIYTKLSAWLLGTALLLGLIAGGDHSRLIFTGIPFLLLFFHDFPLTKKEGMFFTVFSLPFFHLFSTIPDLTAGSVYDSWHPEYAPWQLLMLAFGYTGVCYFLWKVFSKMEFTLPRWLHKRL